MLVAALVVYLSALCGVTAGSTFGQEPLRAAPASDGLGEGPSGAGAFTRFEHPLFPRHSVRVKESRFCDGAVRCVSPPRTQVYLSSRGSNLTRPASRAYTGYIDVETRHLFFYFFESRRDPDADDVVFWINGGPGGSSAIGLFMEHGERSSLWRDLYVAYADRVSLGPCRASGPNSTERFEHSWNEYANVLFVDQPVGTGFSYADHGEYVVRARC